jgi:hypothetical protein
MRAELMTLTTMLLAAELFRRRSSARVVGLGNESETHGEDTWHGLREKPARPYALGKGVLYEVHIYGPETARKGISSVRGRRDLAPRPPVSLSPSCGHRRRNLKSRSRARRSRRLVEGLDAFIRRTGA